VSLLTAIPKPIRDGVYDWVARNRYRWFGRLDQCLVPVPDVQDRFIDQG
jgi:predicted DCC family thiol-disulfide oxidoreductase YuxK